jgi:hypothetical protein
MAPRTIYSRTSCPIDYGLVLQTDCWAWVVDAQGGFLSPFPLYDTGSIGRLAYCRLGTEGLADGTVIKVFRAVTCGYYAPGVVGNDANRTEKEARIAAAKGFRRVITPLYIQSSWGACPLFRLLQPLFRWTHTSTYTNLATVAVGPSRAPTMRARIEIRPFRPNFSELDHQYVATRSIGRTNERKKKKEITAAAVTPPSLCTNEKKPCNRRLWFFPPTVCVSEYTPDQSTVDQTSTFMLVPLLSPGTSAARASLLSFYTFE